MEADVTVSTPERSLKTGDITNHPDPGAWSSTLRFRAGLGLLVVLVAVSVVLASGIGAVHVPSREIVSMLLNRTGFFHLARTWPQSDEIIILQIRLPRVLAAAFTVGRLRYNSVWWHTTCA